MFHFTIQLCSPIWSIYISAKILIAEENLSLSERLSKSGRVQVTQKPDNNNAVCGIETVRIV